MPRSPKVARTELALTEISLIGVQADLDARAAVLNVVPIVESYVDWNITSLVSSSRLRAHPLGEFLLADQAERMLDSWPTRTRVLKEAFSLSLKDLASWEQWDAVLELRNAYMHGNGCLTNRQASHVNKLAPMSKQLALVDCTLSGRRVHTGSATAILAVRAASDFVDEVDGIVWSKLDPAQRIER